MASFDVIREFHSDPNATHRVAEAHAVEDSSPLISYSPSGAWIDDPEGDTLVSVSL